MRHTILVALISLIITSVGLLIPSAAHADCRTACDVDELRDANGCCVPRPSIGPRTPRSPDASSPPSSAPTQPSSPWSGRLRAHHVSAPTDPSALQTIGADATTQPPEDLPLARLEDLEARAWGALLAQEFAVLRAAHSCTAPPQEAARREECRQKLRRLLGDRAKMLATITPLLRALIKRDPTPPWRAQTRYYLAVSLLAQGAAREGVSSLRQILDEQPQSPYAPFALATLGDYFYDTGKPALAMPLYLRAKLHDNSVIQAYASLQQGWCHAQTKEWEEALYAMIQGLDEAKTARGLQQRGALRGALREDISVLYAHVGRADRAAAFWRKLGVSEAVMPRVLLRLARQYEALGKGGEALMLYDALSASSQEAADSAARLRADEIRIDP